MKIERLEALKAWQLALALLGLGVGTALSVWALVWVIWTIRPFLQRSLHGKDGTTSAFGLRRRTGRPSQCKFPITRVGMPR